MAKKKVFGEEAQKKASGQRKMAKVIVSTKTDQNNYAFKEAIVPTDEVRDYIEEKQG